MEAYDRRDAKLRLMGYATYGDYLKSSLWSSIRRRILTKHEFCQVCQRSRAVQVHHTKYTEANLTGQSKDGLVAICRSCHEHGEFGRTGQKLQLGTANTRLLKLAKQMLKPVRPRKTKSKAAGTVRLAKWVCLTCQQGAFGPFPGALCPLCKSDKGFKQIGGSKTKTKQQKRRHKARIRQSANVGHGRPVRSIRLGR